MEGLKLKLMHKYIIQGKIKALSGLHIGGNDAGLSIGSPDATVIKHPISGEPYIPGSSLKGKMRSLTELRDGTIGNRRYGVVLNGPTENPTDLAAQLFGTANNEATQRPSRVIVRDAFLSKENEDHQEDFSVVEVKTEVLIDRVTSKAMPRSMERIPAGATFDFEIVLNVFESDAQHGVERDHLNNVLSSLLLVQDDYLGGKGSRGSGHIKFSIEKISKRDGNYYSNPDQTHESDKTQDFTEIFSPLF